MTWLPAIFYSLVDILPTALSRRSPLRFRQDGKPSERQSNKICIGSHERFRINRRAFPTTEKALFSFITNRCRHHRPSVLPSIQSVFDVGHLFFRECRVFHACPFLCPIVFQEERHLPEQQDNGHEIAKCDERHHQVGQAPS